MSTFLNKFLNGQKATVLFLAISSIISVIGCTSTICQSQDKSLGDNVQAELSAAKATGHTEQQYVYAGNPKPLPSFSYQIRMLTNIGYVVGYCDARKDPAWVGYRLFKVSSLDAPERPSGFRIDRRTSARVSSGAYTKSGYDRGHMAPNYAIAVCYGDKAQRETFLMSNVIPQVPKLNHGIWERLESVEIINYAQEYGEVWVLDGGIYDSTNCLASGVNIPSGCYKIILNEENGTPRVLAFIIPQNIKSNQSLTNFFVSVHDIESKTGLDFFSELPDDIESRLESQVAERLW